MPANEPTLNDWLFNDELINDSLDDSIIDLVLDRVPDIDPKFSNLLRQVLSAQKDEQSRVQRGDCHDVTSFERVQIFAILTTLLLSDHIDTLPRRKRDRSAIQQRVLELLVNADDVFAAARNDVEQNHSDVWAATELPVRNLASKIWFYVYEVKATECEEMANRFTAMLQAAITRDTGA